MDITSPVASTLLSCPIIGVPFASYFSYQCKDVYLKCICIFPSNPCLVSLGPSFYEMTHLKQVHGFRMLPRSLRHIIKQPIVGFTQLCTPHVCVCAKTFD